MRRLLFGSFGELSLLNEWYKNARRRHPPRDSKRVHSPLGREAFPVTRFVRNASIQLEKVSKSKILPSIIPLSPAGRCGSGSWKFLIHGGTIPKDLVLRRVKTKWRTQRW